ncbi:MAG: MerR family DNA-binding transcriptional regulator [Parabacteroides sp.]
MRAEHRHTRGAVQTERRCIMMRVDEPVVKPAGRYGAIEAAKVLGIHRNTLRNYTEQGLIKFGVRRSTGRKFYLGSDLLKFWKAQF